MLGQLFTWDTARNELPMGNIHRRLRLVNLTQLVITVQLPEWRCCQCDLHVMILGTHARALTGALLRTIRLTLTTAIDIHGIGRHAEELFGQTNPSRMNSLTPSWSSTRSTSGGRRSAAPTTATTARSGPRGGKTTYETRFLRSGELRSRPRSLASDSTDCSEEFGRSVLCYLH